MLSTVPLRLFLMGTLIGVVSEGSTHGTRWKCPEFDDEKISCICDFPQTLRCSTDLRLMKKIVDKLRLLAHEEAVSLLDFTVQNETFFPGHLLRGVSLYGLVLTSGELKNVSRNAFAGLSDPLLALGLPNNQMETVPAEALQVLVRLERLDLSYNKLTGLDSRSFRGLHHLRMLDLSSNQIANVTPHAFSGMENLTAIKLKGNRLKVSTVSALAGLEGLEELDLSGNELSGPLEPNTVPVMPSLRTLSLANNQFTSILRGAMRGAPGLRSLSLSHNQIDVLEDDAFQELSSLRVLHLSNNRIVAVSGFSLAHLTELIELDLSHNFLRALTPDIISPLPSLRVLRLDDNDISMVETDTFRRNTSLERLTLSDNPFNCDCNLVDFSIWLNQSSRLSPTDMSTVVCTTPPHLENALLAETPSSELRCEEDDYDVSLQEGLTATHVSSSRIVLRAFNFNGSSLTLLWSTDTKSKSFSCDALFVYEEMSSHEVLLTSTPLRCNSSQMADPTSLVVRLGLGSMQPFHRYRFCIVLLEDNKFTDEMQLVLGCSEIIPLIVTNHSIAQSQSPNVSVKIASLRADMSSGTLSVSIELWNQKKLPESKCHVTVTVFLTGTMLARHVLNCTNPKIFISGLPPRGSYHVCASLEHRSSTERLECVTVESQAKSVEATIGLTVCFLLASTFVFSVLYFACRKIVGRSRLKTTHQCFLASSEFEDQQKQHSRYVKLQTASNM